MRKAVIFALAGLSLLVLQSCSLVGYARRGEKIPPEYVGEGTMKIYKMERNTRELANWLHDYNNSLSGY